MGLNVAVITNNDQVTASIGKDGNITVSNGHVNLVAESDLDAWSITVAAAIKAGGTGSGATIGGGLTVIVSSNEVVALIDDRCAIDASGNVAVIVTGNKAQAILGNYVKVESDGSVTVASINTEKLISILASVSGAAGSSHTAAGTVNLLIKQLPKLATVRIMPI